jgi:glycosyltransferase involved in cell wall biosynthesis
MPENALRQDDGADLAWPAELAERPVKAVFLPNVRMGVKRAALIAEDGPSPLREERGFEQHGVMRNERDLHSFPWNPLVKKGSLLAGLDLLRALKVLLFDRKADVIVSVFESNVFFVLLLRKIFRFKPKIVLWEVSGRGWAKRDKILDYVVPRVDHVFVLTEDQRRKVEAQYKLRNPAQVLGFAIDDEFFRSRSQTVDERYVLAVGDDVSRDYPTLIEACRLAGLPLKLRSNARFAVPENASHVSFVGRLSYKELRDLYEGATIVAVPLKPVDYPGGITAIYEAMSMGKPLVVSRTGMTANFIRHGEDGIFVNPQDPAELGKELLALWNDKPACEALGGAARKRLERDFSYDQYIRRFAMLLRQAAGR